MSVSRACNTTDALTFFAQAAAGEYRALWLRPETGEAIVGVGEACVLESDGPDRFDRVARAWRAVLADAVSEGPGPRLLGGVSFDPRRPRTRLWSGFPAARFVLPSRMLTVRDGAAWLTTNVVRGEPFAKHVAPEPALAATRPLSREAWTELVAGAAAALQNGDLAIEKVVLARALEVPRAAGDRVAANAGTTAAGFNAERCRIDLADIVERLRQSYPSCTIFAFEQGGACFVGASPERLISLHRGTASTMALAGSVPRGSTPEHDAALADGLLANPKERAEHAYVARALRDALAADGLCTSVVASAEPTVRKLPNVQHLFTPIRGQVADGTSVLNLVERLHPTPAVGGYPTGGALDFIREHEGLDRGWYAGAIGWVDADGDGDFVVGIRSALLRGETATLFAGCGIMAESDADAEYVESEWKLQPMLSALRGSGAVAR